MGFSLAPNTPQNVTAGEKAVMWLSHQARTVRCKVRSNGDWWWNSLRSGSSRFWSERRPSVESKGLGVGGQKDTSASKRPQLILAAEGMEWGGGAAREGDYLVADVLMRREKLGAEFLSLANVESFVIHHIAALHATPDAIT
ncbi:hypothetical protein M407DRAFT_227989 [Tulasnella calospora MUT 4182]|uniref:Uncharacterized protein n=1 Tax=Tulasnella calospora MUT 4182 TaxID=1051891 RepID=A0A0C3PS93_9AGAM|nr:hypothetical protein M407DRAFT_227989 [Tulasnella calospora MUT 4182]